MTDFKSISDKLTDAEARKLLEQVAPRARTIAENIVRNNTRAEQGQAQMVALQARAKEHFGTDDLGEMRRILDERMTLNAQNVKAWLANLDETEAKLRSVAQPVAGR